MQVASSLDFEIASSGIEELDDGGYGAVVCRAVLHHLDPLVPILREVHRVLEPGGALICSDEPTVRNDRDLERLKRENVFVQYGVEETALRKADYVLALGEAGFEDVHIGFPVSWNDYRRYVRPTTNVTMALPLYLRYRLRSSLRPAPGEVRSIVARKPS
jgi:SAM-dependent methyltransferase